MGETPPKATFDVTYPSGDANFTSSNFRSQYQSLYQGDVLAFRPLAHTVPDLSIMVLGNDAADYHRNVYIENVDTRITLSSGDSSTMAAPSANPRYDLVYIDPSGNIEIETGSEGASPTIPAAPSGDIFPVCAIYHRTTTTKIVNYADKDSYTGDSYIAADLRPLYTMPTTATSDFSEVRVYNSASQANFTDNTYEKVEWDNESYDTQNEFDLANEKFTASSDGKYLITCNCLLSNVDAAANKNHTLAIYVNNAARCRNSNQISAASTQTSIFVGDVLDLSTNDYVEIFFRSGNGDNLLDFEGNSENAVNLSITQQS